MLVEPWRIILLGELKARQANSAVTRFRTRKAASLFAFLACHLHRSHSREELSDRFWPDDFPETARTKFRLALASLRRQLEPAGVQANTVIVADRTHISLNVHAVETDVAAFEAGIKEANSAPDALNRIRLLKKAVQRYTGDLVPGDYEEWALQERDRLRDIYLSALAGIVKLSTDQDDLNAAISYSRRLVLADPLEETAHVALMRLYVLAGRPHSAARQYAELTACLKKAFDSLPGEEANALAATLRPSPAPQKDKGRNRAGASKTTASHSSALSYSERPCDAASLENMADNIRSTEQDENDPGRCSTTPLKHPRVSVTPPALSFDLRLPVFLTRCFGRHEAVRTLAGLLAPDVEAGSGSERNAQVNSHAPDAFEPSLHSAQNGISTGRTSSAGAPARLVTLIGPGGSGKTRLAVETAHFIQSKVTYPVAFIALAEVAEAGQILRHIAEALHLPQPANADPMSQIADRLQATPALLVLDNFEQLTSGGVSILQALLTRLPDVLCLVTSRQHLRLPGERPFAVPPLSVSESQQLFLDRAQSVRPDFQITSHNAPSVAMLCEVLEGIPLALEIAATWVGVLTPAQMLARMNRGFDFDLLVSRRNDRTARHRALYATIAWSYELLSPELQTFLARMSVFRGGWTEAAAHAVGSAGHALLLLAQLRERSLVVSEPSANGATTRFRLLDSVREFADAQMDVQTRQEIRRAHAAYFFQMAEDADKNISGPEQEYWFACLDPEQPNISAVLNWQAGETKEAEAQLRLTVAMRVFWRAQGRLAESRTRLEAVLARPGVEACSPAYCTAVGEVGLVASMQGDQNTAREYAERALRLARQDDNPTIAASALNTLGNAAKRLREYETAHSFYMQTLQISREISDRRMEAMAIANLGNIAQEQGEYAQAAECYRESLAVYRKLQNKQGLIIQLYNLASLNVQTDDYVRAAPLLAECLGLCREIGDMPTIMHALEVSGYIADEFAQPTLAIRLYAAAAQMRGRLGLPMSARGRAYMDEVLAAARSRVGSERFDSLWKAGTDAPIEEAIAQAIQVHVSALPAGEDISEPAPDKPTSHT